MKKPLWLFASFLAICIGFYPSLYFTLDRKFGLLGSKSAALLSNVVWNIGFYTHIILGGLALLIGWTQFNARWRTKYMKTHRLIGETYIIAALLSGFAGIYIAFFATGGWLNSLGFLSLGIIWTYTTWTAFSEIKNKRVEAHQKMMIYSYAACFSAVTLRLWMPLLIMTFKEFDTAYAIVAWLAWLPNMVVAYWIVKNKSA